MSSAVAEALPPRARSGGRPWAAIGAVAILLAAELAIFALATERRDLLRPVVYRGPLSSWQPTPLAHHLPALSASTATLRVVFLLLLAAMVPPYLLAVSRARLLSGRWVAAAVVAGNVVALIGPLVVTDVYNYVDFARLAAVHHLNPYVSPPTAAPGDPFFNLVAWQWQPTSYGPLFTIASYPLALLSPSHAVWAYKLVTFIASLGCTALVYLCALRLGRPARACALAVGLNPVVLVYAAGGGHNDFLMMVLVLAGVYVMLAGRATRAVPTLVAAAGVKAVAAPVLLFALIHARRLRLAALAAACAVALAVLMVVAFGTHLPGLSAQARVITPLSVPDAFGRAIGVSARTGCTVVYDCARDWAQIGADVALLAAMAVLAWRAWRGADWITCAGWAMVALTLTLTSVMPWYLVWVLPLAALSRSRALHAAAAALTALLVVAAVPATFLLGAHY
jgi:hypothetical protein